MRCFLIVCSFHSLVLFVGRNDGFDAGNNDNFFKILWSNLINFDKECEIYQISIMSEGEKEKKRQLCVKMSSNYEFKIRKTCLKLDLV